VVQPYVGMINEQQPQLLKINDYQCVLFLFPLPIFLQSNVLTLCYGIHDFFTFNLDVSILLLILQTIRYESGSQTRKFHFIVFQTCTKYYILTDILA
jgi:hypothetical protein